jgi:hypothetical protein
MEYVIAGYLRQVWEMNGWLYEVKHGFKLGYSCESQVVTVCQNTTDSLDEGVMTDAIIIDFSKAKFSKNINEPGWETLAQRRLMARICALLKAYTGGWA